MGMPKKSVEDLLREAMRMPLGYELSNDEISNFREMTTGIVPYFIAFTARSGSTFLTHELFATKVLSQPHEWFNWDNLKESEFRGETGFSKYFEYTLNNNRSRNGIFGCEINSLQLQALRSIIEPHALFKNKIRWFYLRRRNVVAQAISLFIADQTSFFHSYQCSDAAIERVESTTYDASVIKANIRNFVAQERFFDQWFRDTSVVPVNIFYEDITRDPSSVVMLFANVLGVRLANSFGKISAENPIKKIGGVKNAEFEKRFRDEEAEFIAEQFNARGSILDHAKGL